MTKRALLNTAPLPVKLRVEDYAMLCRSGAFDAYRKTELIDGVVLFMNAQHRAHMRIKSELAYRMRRALEDAGNSLFVGTEGTIDMPPNDAPEPDIVLTSEADGDGPIPLPSVALVVEVSDTTLATDLGAKLAMYARHAVPEYWVVDLEGRTIVMHAAPADEHYGSRKVVAWGEEAQALTIPELRIANTGLSH